MIGTSSPVAPHAYSLLITGPRFKLRTRKALRREDNGLTDEATETIPVAIAAFNEKLKQWRSAQRKLMPLLHPPTDSESDVIALDAPEDDDDDEESGEAQEVLGLPSDFNASEIEHYSLNLLATYELKIRVGLAFDQLEEVRQSVRHASAFLDSKETHAQGTKEHTRANTEISKSRELSRRLADRYNHNVGRINTLRHILDPQGASSGSDMSSRLKLINKQKDLLISDLRAARTKGESKQSGSWIWSVFEIPADAPKKRTSTRKRKQENTSSAQPEEPSVTAERDPEWLRSGMCSSYVNSVGALTLHL